MRIRNIRYLPIYAILIVGSAVYSLPFLWMVSTSIKVDRELFTKQLHFVPREPLPQDRSPYVDATVYDELDEGPNEADLLAALPPLVKAVDFDYPADLDKDAAEAQMVRGVYQRLSELLPRKVWEGTVADVLENGRRHINEETLTEVFRRIHRRLCIGSVRVRNVEYQDEVLGTGIVPRERCDSAGHLQTAKVGCPITDVVLTPWVDEHTPCVSYNYDLSKTDRITLSQTFRVGFDLSKLQRIQINMRPDDSWHGLEFSFEKLGKRYEPEGAMVLANYNWYTATFQEPGPDDFSTKPKTWTLIHEAGPSPATANDPHLLKVNLELKRTNYLMAWVSKLRLNFYGVLRQIPFVRYVRTSLFLVFANITLTLLACSLVAYAFARLQWPGRDFCFLLMLATMMIPPQVTMIPHFLIWKNLGGYNTLAPLWLGSAFGSAFFIFLLRQFLKGIPRDLEDAARIDGCGFLRIYAHIMLPLIKPSLAAIAIFTFMGTWNDFMGPLIYIADQRLYPLAFGLYAFSVQVYNNPALTMAGSLLMTFPVIVLFFLAQRYFIEGITLTGIRE